MGEIKIKKNRGAKLKSKDKREGPDVICFLSVRYLS